MIKNTKKICEEYGIVPTRTKGQNFLITEKIYDDIVSRADLSKNDTVLEVGPGLGFLTEKLAEKAGKVVAVELDDGLFNVLKERLKGLENLAVFNDNVLDMEIGKWELPGLGGSASGGESWKVVANLPYNITSIFLRKIFALENKPETLVLMLQKEVAERIAAVPGKMSLLSVSVQFFADAEIVEYVSRENFWPMPEVDSAVIKLIINKEKLIIQDIKKYFQLVKIGFSQRRKMLKNNLANGFHVSQETAGEWLTGAGFDLKVRAQELSVKDWGRLLLQQKGFDK